MADDALYVEIFNVLVDEGGYKVGEARDKLNALLESHHCRSCDDHACFDPFDSEDGPLAAPETRAETRARVAAAVAAHKSATRSLGETA